MAFIMSCHTQRLAFSSFRSLPVCKNSSIFSAILAPTPSCYNVKTNTRVVNKAIHSSYVRCAEWLLTSTFRLQQRASYIHNNMSKLVVGKTIKIMLFPVFKHHYTKMTFTKNCKDQVFCPSHVHYRDRY